MSETSIPRIQLHGNGIGEISDDDVRRRAEELALLENRSTPNKADHQRALDELRQVGPPPPPEADESHSPIRKWSEAIGSAGHQAPRVGFEDDQITQRLVEEGVEEADGDQRLSASQAERLDEE